MTEKEFKILLDKVLNGNATKQEEELLLKFEERAINENEGEVFSNDIEKKIVKEDIHSEIKKNIKPNYSFKLGVAASILLLIGLSSFWFFNTSKNTESLIVSNTSNEFKEVLLKDGTTVILNANTTIKYIDNYNGTRFLDLKGEAFFKVKRNEKKPFIVKTKDIKTEVLGTSFNIKDRDSIVKVTVATGLVKVYNANQSVLLKPNEQTKYKRATGAFITKKTLHQFAVSWFTETISLDNVSLLELSDYIKYKYNVDTKFLNNDLKKLRMSLSISRDESIENVVHQINYINELKLTINQNNMIEIK